MPEFFPLWDAQKSVKYVSASPIHVCALRSHGGAFFAVSLNISSGLQPYLPLGKALFPISPLSQSRTQKHNKNSIRRKDGAIPALEALGFMGAEIKRPAPARLRGTKRCQSSKAWLGWKRDGFVEFCRQLPPQIRSMLRAAVQTCLELVSSAGTRAQRSCAATTCQRAAGNLPACRFGLT